MSFFNKRIGSAVCLALLLGIIAVVSGQTGNRGFDPANIDPTFKPCEDFFRYANGGWIAKNPIPAAFTIWGTSSQLGDNNRKLMLKILEEAASRASSTGGNEQKIGAFFASCMDEAQIEKEGLKPLAEEFERIEKINDQRSLHAEIARLHAHGVGAVFGFASTPDPKSSRLTIGEAVQGGLGLPDRDYYTKDDEKSRQLRGAYFKYISRMFELLGDDPSRAGAQAAVVMTMETKLAEASMTQVEQRDPNAVYNKMGLAALKQLMPNFSWEEYFKEVGAPAVKEINVGQPLFFKEVNRQLGAVPLTNWKSYLRFHLINTAAPYLSEKFVDENFNFYGRTLSGAKEKQPRWRRCVTATDAELGEALGEAYVRKAFTPESKARMQEMVKNLIAAFREKLSRAGWMSETTRKQALAKLDAFGTKIGYPEKWRDYSALQLDRGAYITNVLRTTRFEHSRDIGKIGKPVDRTEWRMTPPTVNAYNSSLRNEIVFPAGILQPPFFDPQADDAINYGAIGAVIGHEITHGFDDEGRQFDAEGNLKEWWTPQDMKSFQKRADCVVNQFSSYKVEEGPVNGKLVVGESIADLGGLRVAYAAFMKSLEGKPKPKEIDGFTPEQRFFLGWAQVWARSVRSEQVRVLLNVDPHPLAQFRVNGPLSNMPEFARAFGCKAGDPMVRAASESCEVW